MNIAIVGAGKGGTSILKSFVNIPGIKITQVYARKPDAPGMVLARSMGISTITSLDDINSTNLDIIVEATGVQEVVDALKSKYEKYCSIIDSHGASLIMALANRDIEAFEKLENQMNTIKETSKKIQQYINEITSSINDTSEISRKLAEFTKTSDNHIEETNKVIKYVNDISKQIHILGINASIEATRAGEQGRGFSVVADEVQKLANGSAVSAKSIQSILDMLSKEILGVKSEVDVLEKLTSLQVTAVQNVCGEINQMVKVIE